MDWRIRHLQKAREGDKKIPTFLTISLEPKTSAMNSNVFLLKVNICSHLECTG